MTNEDENEDDRLRNETLDQLYDLAPGASRGWWCGARDDPGRAPCVRIVHQLVKDGFMNATFGENDWIVSAQLTPRGREDVSARRACALDSKASEIPAEFQETTSRAAPIVDLHADN